MRRSSHALRRERRDGIRPHGGVPASPVGSRQPYVRNQTPAREVYEKGRLRIDFSAYEVFLDNRRVQLALRQFELLRFFVQFPNHVFDRQTILASVWGEERELDPRNVDVRVHNLRKMIEPDAAHPVLIVTVRGVGYKFDDRGLQRETAERVSLPDDGAGLRESKNSPARF